MTDIEKRRSMGLRSYRVSQLISFALSLVVLVLGALTMAFSIVRMVTGEILLFGNTDPAFQLLVGFVIVIVGSLMMPNNRRAPP